MAIATHLIDAFAGAVLAPGDGGWDAARQAFNTDIDQRPAAIAMPTDALDVADALRFAARHGLRVAPQRTGHNAGPLGDLRDVLLLKTDALGGVEIDVGARRVRVGAATRWEQVTPRLSELGLAALHGSSPDVGIVGYSLGGGIGWLARKHGMQTNAVTAIELITADGRFVRADREHEPDLFWALRGGGGNFGVVTALEFEVFPVRELYAGALFFEVEQTADVLHAWTELLPHLPEEITSWANVLHFPPLPELPAAIRGRSFAIVMAAFLGSEADGRELLRPLRRLRPLIDTFAMQAPAGLGDLAMDPREPLPFRSAHALIDALPAAAIDDVARISGPGSSLALVQLRHMGGALSRRDPDAGARATLPGEICVFGLGVVPEASAEPAVLSDLAALSAAVAPRRVGDYPNFVEQPVEVSGFFDPGTWERLRRVKALYDPQDLFKANHHIPA
ncbi:FAD-binding oxidoreductase [Solirubrobacter ginsenosidimutans]|uniref:FAD-binding oxidoreductase n=1 Tax=Solirubrobacter ginsenosidimutans TaxID=490573 RepID=A0A9X3MW96_9ACTN|nr:FAD-binding oxidoreductase [Solirubrobacter ginsenosidimutans]MDA0164076.1 FAD-binding oxidoreductase [Solirubrobacter ginsenosidimutans]